MWQQASSEEFTDLRQGDLLLGLKLPQLQMPLAHIVRKGQASEAVAALNARPYVVVSQCCTVANGKSVAVAPVRSTPPLTTAERLAYTAITPAELPREDGNQVSFAYSGMALESLPPHIVPGQKGQLPTVSFDEIQSYTGDRQALLDARVARMTPAGRRRLRIRLALFWGRAEGEDAELLRAQGIDDGQLLRHTR